MRLSRRGVLPELSWGEGSGRRRLGSASAFHFLSCSLSLFLHFRFILQHIGTNQHARQDSNLRPAA